MPPPKVIESSSVKVPLMVAIENGNITAFRNLIMERINLFQNDDVEINILNRYEPTELAQCFSESASDHERILRKNQMQCLFYILEAMYKRQYQVLCKIILVISISVNLKSAAQKVLHAVEKAKESLQILNEIKTPQEAERQAKILVQYSELYTIILLAYSLLLKLSIFQRQNKRCEEKNHQLLKASNEYAEFELMIMSGQRHIGKIVAGTMLGFFGVLGIIAGVGLILTGVGIPLAILLKMASIVALYSGAAAISVGLIGVIGGGALAYCNRERGVKCAAGKFFKASQTEILYRKSQKNP